MKPSVTILPVLVFFGMANPSRSATLLLHYGMGEEGTIDASHHLVSTVPGEPEYKIGNVSPACS